MSSSKFGFGLSMPPTDSSWGRALKFDIKEFCDGIISEERIRFSILATYTLNLEHLTDRCSALLDTPTLIFHGDRSVKDEEILVLCRAFAGETRCRFVNPTKHDYTNRSLQGSSASSIETISSRGVHHPKYVAVVTENNLHLAISTANLVRDRSMNIAWRRSFKRCEKSIDKVCEFGIVLEDFIKNVRYWNILSVLLILTLYPRSNASNLLLTTIQRVRSYGGGSFVRLVYPTLRQILILLMQRSGSILINWRVRCPVVYLLMCMCMPGRIGICCAWKIRNEF